MVQETRVVNGQEQVKQMRKIREHQVHTVEPSGQYLYHSEIQEDKGTGRGLSEDFYEMLIEHDSVETLEAVILDGTSVNTGWKTGLPATLERHPNIKRKLLWLVCMLLLHGNELDFRHLFCHCDGGYGTSGPDSFKGPL